MRIDDLTDRAIAECCDAADDRAVEALRDALETAIAIAVQTTVDAWVDDQLTLRRDQWRLLHPTKGRE